MAARAPISLPMALAGLSSATCAHGAHILHLNNRLIDGTLYEIAVFRGEAFIYKVACQGALPPGPPASGGYSPLNFVVVHAFVALPYTSFIQMKLAARAWQLLPKYYIHSKTYF